MAGFAGRDINSLISPIACALPLQQSVCKNLMKYAGRNRDKHSLVVGARKDR